MNISVLGTQSSTHFYIDLPGNLTTEQCLVFILKTILDEISGIVTDEFNQPITDEVGTIITFDNTNYYPEMPLSLWRMRINGNWLEHQIVFNLREANVNN